MSVYNTPEWKGFVSRMRATDPADVVGPLAAADWLEDAGKADHAGFVRGCVRLRQLRDVLDECLKADLHYTDPTRSVPEREYDDLVYDLRPLINLHCHEWVGGACRRFNNPTVFDWPNGFLREWSVEPLAGGSDRMRPVDGRPRRRLRALLSRQPVARVTLRFPVPPFASPRWHLEKWAADFPGVTFAYPGLPDALVPAA